MKDLVYMLSSVCDAVTPQIIPDKVPNIFRCLRWSARFFDQLFQNARRSRAQVGALAWVRVGVGVGVRVRVGRRPLSHDLTKKKHKNKKKNSLKTSIK